MTRPGSLAQIRRLVPAFFVRFFENELTTGADDLKSVFFALLAILAVPGFVMPLFLAGASAPVPAATGFGTDPSGWGWSMIARFQGVEALRVISRADKTFYLGFAMIASGMVSVIAWSTLLLDRRDRLVFGPLPVRGTTVVVAKLVALSAYISMIALAMHALASVAFGTALASNNTVGFALRGIAAHFLASFAASVFVMASVVAVQGLTLAALGPRMFARVSTLLQLCLVAIIISGVIALPAISGSVVSTLRQQGDGAWILATPPLWFLGLYERVLGTDDRMLLDLARTATIAMLVVLATSLGAYLLAHRRLLPAVVDVHSGGPRLRRSAFVIGILTAAVGRAPEARAVARFFLTTVTRNHRHRLVMAGALGAAAAWGPPGWIALVNAPQVPQVSLLSWALTTPLFLAMGLRIAGWLPVERRAAWLFEMAMSSFLSARGAPPPRSHAPSARRPLALPSRFAGRPTDARGASPSLRFGEARRSLAESFEPSGGGPPPRALRASAFAEATADKSRDAALWPSARLAMERTMFVVGVLPVVMTFALVYWWLWGAQVAILHVLFSISTGTLLIEMVLWRFEGVPCTRPWNPDVFKPRLSWPLYLAAFITLTPGLPGLELLLLSQPIASVCFALYVLAVARQIRMASLSRQPGPSADPVDVLTAALRSARLSTEPGQATAEEPSSDSSRGEMFGVRRAAGSEVAGWRLAIDGVRGLPDHLTRDLRLAVRRLFAAPIFTTFSVLTLGCGIGITTAVYSVVHAVLWTPPPIPEVGRVVDLAADEGRSSVAFSWPDFQDLRDRQTTFSGLAAATLFQATFVGGTVGEVVHGEAVNGSFFQTFAIRPVLGRMIQPADDQTGAPPVAVLSYSVWRLRFGADPDVIGRTVKIDTRLYEVIGVAPDGFRGWDFSNLAFVPAIWVPLANGPDEVRERTARSDRDGPHWIVVKGRLAPERSVTQASAELMTIGFALETAFPTPGSEPALGRQSRFGRRWSAGPVGYRDKRDSRQPALIGRMFVGAVALVLLIGCTNLANLALARGSSREHELAVRRALGASRADLVREQLVESTLVAAASALLAALIIRAATTSLTLEVPAGPGRFVLIEPHLNSSVLIFAAAAGVFALVTFGIWPALQLTGTPAREGLSTEAGTTPPHWHVHRRLIGWQVAASACLFLLAAACINVIVVSALHDSGVDVDRLAIVGIDFETNRYDVTLTRSATEAVISLAAQHPDVAAISASRSLPFGMGVSREWSAARADSQTAASSETVQFIPATPAIFRTLGVAIVRGRGLTAQDTAIAPRVAVINESFAIRLWGTKDVVGRELLLTNSRMRGRTNVERLTIAGVSADTDVGSTGSREHGVVYVPLDQHYQTMVYFTARSTGDPRAALAALRAALRQVDPDFVVDGAATGMMYLAGHYVVLGFVAALVTTLGTLALLLAMSGLFGVISHVVSRRTRELGVRIALGAERHRIMRLVFVDGLRPVIDGLVLGLFAGAICRSIVAATMSASVAAVDPIAFLIVPVLFVVTALCACYWPARRASRVDPNVALRQL